MLKVVAPSRKDILYSNSEEGDDLLVWLHDTLLEGTYKVLLSEAGGNFYISYIIFSNIEDMNLFLLTTKIKGIQIEEEDILL